MSGRLVVLGIMGRTPFAGVAWQALHYLEGFRRLGWDVFYVEDTGDWPYDPEQNAVTDDGSYTIRYLARLMDRCGLSGRWAYRAAAQGGRVYGMSAGGLARLFASADVLVNVTGATVLGDDSRQVPVRIYVETDPVRPQIEVAQGRKFTIELLEAHTHHFTFGENLGAPDCRVPLTRFAYRPTRQPVVLDWWAAPERPDPTGEDGRRRFTTVASWRQSGKDVEWGGQVYRWSKHEQFLALIDLPRRTRQHLELALACDDPDAVGRLRADGWHVRDALALSRDTDPYRRYIQDSDGEFTVAKPQYVLPRSGWFSDRSACYLAAGRPVVTQETGFSRVLSTGRGLLAFSTADEAVAALEAVAADYRAHARAAREIAAEYFAAERVLGDLLTAIG